ncbi:hypothetical protein ACE1TI_08790 [Alteribacillus sp. JSM 102045]
MGRKKDIDVRKVYDRMIEEYRKKMKEIAVQHFKELEDIKKEGNEEREK